MTDTQLEYLTAIYSLSPTKFPPLGPTIVEWKKKLVSLIKDVDKKSRHPPVTEMFDSLDCKILQKVLENFSLEQRAVFVEITWLSYNEEHKIEECKSWIGQCPDFSNLPDCVYYYLNSNPKLFSSDRKFKYALYDLRSAHGKLLDSHDFWDEKWRIFGAEIITELKRLKLSNSSSLQEVESDLQSVVIAYDKEKLASISAEWKKKVVSLIETAKAKPKRPPVTEMLDALDCKILQKMLPKFSLEQRALFVEMTWPSYNSEHQIEECKWWINRPTLGCLPISIRDCIERNKKYFKISSEFSSLKANTYPFGRHDFWDEAHTTFHDEIISELKRLKQLKLPKPSIRKDEPILVVDSETKVPSVAVVSGKRKYDDKEMSTVIENKLSTPNINPQPQLLSPVLTPTVVISNSLPSPILAFYCLTLISLTEADVERLTPEVTKEEVEDRDDIKKYLSAHFNSEEMTRYENHLSTVATLKKKLTTEYLIEVFIKRGIAIPSDCSFRLPASIFDGKDLGPAFVPPILSYKPKSRWAR